MEDVKTYFEGLPLASGRHPIESFKEWYLPKERVPTFLNGLEIMVHLLAGGFFAVATAFTIEFVLLMSFWQGVVFGGLCYALLIILLGASENV